MEPDIQASRRAVPAELEAQLRECFGRVVYSHKSHEKCADRLQRRLGRIKFWQILLAAVTTGGLIAAVFGDQEQSRYATVLSAVLSTALLALNTYTKDFDPGQVAQEHKAVADRLWTVRESYLSLLTDILASAVSDDVARKRRDELQEELATIYESAPRTFDGGYRDAQKALKLREDLTFSDQEIDQFLPQPLKRSARTQGNKWG